MLSFNEVFIFIIFTEIPAFKKIRHSAASDLTLLYLPGSLSWTLGLRKLINGIYHKTAKNSGTQTITVIILKFEQCGCTIE